MLIKRPSCRTVSSVSATYEQLIDVIAASDYSRALPAETMHMMEDLRIPHELQMQLKKLLVAGNSDRALKLIQVYRESESWWTKTRRKLGV